jgi:hypothetical protein
LPKLQVIRPHTIEQVEARGATEATRRSAEMEMRQSSLVSQTNLLAKENQILREQVWP